MRVTNEEQHLLWIVWTLSKYLEKDELWLDLPFRHLMVAGAPRFTAALAPAPLPLAPLLALRPPLISPLLCLSFLLGV